MTHASENHSLGGFGNIKGNKGASYSTSGVWLYRKQQKCKVDISNKIVLDWK